MSGTEQRISFRIFAFPLALAAGCGAPPSDLSETDLAAMTDNGLTDNALSDNALTDNALTDNALTDNALTDNALTDNALTDNALTDNALTDNALTDNGLHRISRAIRDPGSAGDLARQFLKYTISCALGPSKSLSFTWTDAGGVPHAERFAGSLDLAPGWGAGGASDADRRWVSACLAARVNAAGVSIHLSMRAAHHALVVKAAERADFGYPEGGFYGNLFPTDGSRPAVYSCRAHRGPGTPAPPPANTTGRLCANGRPGDCGPIVITGLTCWAPGEDRDCHRMGGRRDAHGNHDYATRCGADRTPYVISTWLKTR